MRGTGVYSSASKLHMKTAAQAHTNKELYRKHKYVCWQCQKDKYQNEITQTRLGDIGGPMKIVCHDCRDAAKQKREGNVDE